MKRLFLSFLLLGGCRREPTRFPVVITALTDDARPFSDLAVTLGRTPVGRTDSEGQLRVRVNGKEGTEIAVSTVVPKGYKLAAPLVPLVLRRLSDSEGGAEKIVPIEYTLKLAPLEREYAILVRGGVPGLSVETGGSRRAVTNSRGVAMFVYRGAPGDELQVKLSTADHPELRPQNPIQSFLLGPRAEAYVVHASFAP